MKNALKKVYSVLYWRLYGVVSKALLLGAKLYAGLFVAQAERKYWLMNAARVIRNRRDTTERKTFEQLLKAKKLSRKEYRHLRRDFIRCERKYGIAAEEYTALAIQDCNENERNRIVSRWRQFHIVFSLNPAEERWRIDDKKQFIKTFRNYIGRESLDVAGGTKEEFFSFVKRHTRFLAKPTDGMSGKGIYAVDCTGKSEAELETLHKELAQCHMLAEQFIVQTGILHQINPSSVNTVRIATLYDGQNPTIAFAFMRTGCGSSLVDNLHAGGIVWPVNHHTGIVSGRGYQTSGEEFEAHPTTGIRVMGMQIPKWQEAVDIVKEAAMLVPELRFISWDVVISDDRISLIEANSNGGFWRPYEKDFDMWGEIKAFMDRTLGENRPMRYF